MLLWATFLKQRGINLLYREIFISWKQFQYGLILDVSDLVMGIFFGWNVKGVLWSTTNDFFFSFFFCIEGGGKAQQQGYSHHNQFTIMKDM
jgi:hypothetical protein